MLVTIFGLISKQFWNFWKHILLGLLLFDISIDVINFLNCSSFVILPMTFCRFPVMITWNIVHGISHLPVVWIGENRFTGLMKDRHALHPWISSLWSMMISVTRFIALGVSSIMTSTWIEDRSFLLHKRQEFIQCQLRLTTSLWSILTLQSTLIFNF